MWLVFHDEGTSLHSLMYGPKAPAPPVVAGTPPTTSHGEGTLDSQPNQAAAKGLKGTAEQQGPQSEQTQQGEAGQANAGPADDATASQGQSDSPQVPFSLVQPWHCQGPCTPHRTWVPLCPQATISVDNSNCRCKLLRLLVCCA